MILVFPFKFFWFAWFWITHNVTRAYIFKVIASVTSQLSAIFSSFWPSSQNTRFCFCWHALLCYVFFLLSSFHSFKSPLSWVIPRASFLQSLSSWTSRISLETHRVTFELKSLTQQQQNVYPDSIKLVD